MSYFWLSILVAGLLLPLVLGTFKPTTAPTDFPQHSPTYGVIRNFLKSGYAHCHKNCNNHGTCDYDDLCTCYAGYTGPDCSLRTCNTAQAWIDKPSDVDVAHNKTAECSNRGLCDRNTGKCKCFGGYTGDSCERQSCGYSNCNGYGFCMTTGQMYNIYTRSGLTTPDSNVYTGWEADKTAMCVCDMGRTGSSCEMKMCPKGNDPLTETTGYKAIRIDTISAASPSTLTGGTFRVIFNDQSFTFDADIDNWDAATCEAKFESLHNIGTVQCIEGIMSGNSKNMTVKFLTWPTIPYENNIFTNDGSASAGEFRCDTSQVDSSGGFVGCSITDVTNSTAILPEYEYCSRRGVCNFNTGECKCAAGFTGSNCDTLSSNYAYTNISLPGDVMSINATNAEYSHSLLVLGSILLVEDDTPYHSALYMTTRDLDLLTIDGYGNVNASNGYVNIALGAHIGRSMHSENLGEIITDGLYTTLGGTINAGGVCLTTTGRVTGGMTIYAAGLNVVDGFTSSKRVNLDSGDLVVTAGGATISLGGYYVTTGDVQITGGLYTGKHGITIRDDGLSITGGLTIISSIFGGGIHVVDDGGTVLSGGLVVTNGMTITLDSLLVTGGVSITDGITTDLLTMRNGGLSVSGTDSSTDHSVTSGLVTTGGITIASSGILVTGGLTVGSSMLVTGGLTVNTNGALVAAAGGTISSDGLYLYNGLTVTNTGLRVVSGGLTVTNDGMTVTGTLTIHSAGFSISGYQSSDSLTIADGVTIYTDGINIGGSLTLDSGGMVVTSGGMIVPGDLTVSDSVTVYSDGLWLTDGNMDVTANSIFSRSATIKGSVTAGSCTVLANGLTISNGGLSVTDGMNVDGFTVSSRMSVVGGATISTSGVVVTDGGVTIGDDGLKTSTVTNVDTVLVSAGGVTIADSGLVTNKDITIGTGGISMAGVDIDHFTFVILKDGLHVDGKSSFNSGGVSVSNHGLTLDYDGLTVTGGLSVYAGKLIVTGNVEVADGGLSIGYNGLTVSSSGVTIAGGMTISDYGLAVTNDGITAVSDGIRVSAGGLTISQDGLAVSGGASVNDLGIRVKSGGLSIIDGGFRAPSGLTITNGGLSANGLTVTAGGLYITGDSTISGGFSVKDGVTIPSEGADVSSITTDATAVIGNVEVTGETSVVDAAYVFDGIDVVTGGVTIDDDGFFVTRKGMTISGSGLHVEGGLTVDGVARFETALSYPSDRRLKENLVPLTNSLQLLRRLHGVTYKWVNEHDSEEHVGLIAQQVKEVLPEVVKQLDSGEFLGINYVEIVPLVIEAIREIDQLIEEYYPVMIETNYGTGVKCHHEHKEALLKSVAMIQSRIESLEGSTNDLLLRMD